MLAYIDATEFVDGTVSLAEVIAYNQCLYLLPMNEYTTQPMYDEVDKVGKGLHEMLCYNITHMELSSSMYGTSSKAHDPKSFDFEVRWINSNMKVYINMN